MATEQIDKAVEEIDDGDLGVHESVHQVRKRCKKIRALLRLARGELEKGGVYARENAVFRDAARALSDLRDAEAVVETYDELLETFEGQADVERLRKERDVLLERKEKVAAMGRGAEERLEIVSATLRKARNRVVAWEIGPCFDALAPGLKKTYGRGRKAMRAVEEDPSTEALHEWRKRVKYHRYHVRVLRSVWSPVWGAWRDELHGLSSLLGDDHDLAVFGSVLTEEAAAFPSDRDLQALLGLADRRRAELQAEAFPLARRLFAEKPKHLARRFRVCWEASRSYAETGSSKVEADVYTPADT